MTALTNLNISQTAGQAAYLPNQPIIQNCLVSANQSTALVPGAIVTFATDANKPNYTVVKQAAVTDLPCGVVVYQGIKSGFAKGERCSIFPAGSFVYLPAASSGIDRGDKLQFTAANKVAATSTASNGYIGTAWTESTAEGDLIVVKIEPSI